MNCIKCGNPIEGYTDNKDNKSRLAFTQLTMRLCDKCFLEYLKEQEVVDSNGTYHSSVLDER